MPPERATALFEAAPEPMVRVDALRRIDVLCAELDGDLEALFARVQLDPALLANRHAMFPLRTLALLFERAAADFACADFALRLAEVQGGEGLFGPLDIAMRHSPTLGAALGYAAENFRAYSPGIRAALVIDEEQARLTLSAALPPGPGKAAVEMHCLLSFCRIVSRLTERGVKPISIEIPYEYPLYVPYFQERVVSSAVAGTEAHIDFRPEDLARAVPGADPLLLELATDFVETRYPGPAQVLSARVRANIERFLEEGPCTQERVAATLAMHPRTLQRRLKAEGLSFEALKNEVRRDLAWRLLTGSEAAFVSIARRIGHADASVLSRACLRWFGASPRAIRRQGPYRRGG